MLGTFNIYITNIEVLLTIIHKHVPRDKMYMYCSMKKQYMKRDMKMLIILSSLGIHSHMDFTFQC